MPRADILLITGMSGAGRSGAAAVLEDLGWYVIDNLPTSLVDTIVELVSKPGSDIHRLALVAGRQHVELLPKVAALRANGHRVRMLFLDASTTALVKRYDATRRKHPLDGEAPGLVEAIDLERALLQPVKSAADLVIDTTELNVHQLKAKLLAAFDEVGDGIHGFVPEDALAGIMGRDAWWSVPAAVLLGIPLYSNAAGVVPVVQALVAKGAALGTVLAFMMAVVGLSLPEMIILRRVLKPRLIATFIGVVGAGIIFTGYLFNMVLAR